MVNFKFYYCNEVFCLERSSQLDLIKEIGYLTTAKAQVRAMPNLFRILIRTRKMKKKWPFTFPKELLSKKVSELREEYGVSILTPEERDIKRIKWSGLIESH